ncbi:hypothetical protein BAE44_0023319, partial [Dichanthelium oligosanthes]
LIVIDDIRDISVWETIKPALIGNNQGSGIIATTYKVDVAESIGGVYRLPLLSDEDSKILFYRRIYFDSEDRCPHEYRELCKSILNKCGRLPLAIITITSLLRNYRDSEVEWRKVCNSIGSGIELGGSVNDMRRTLSRSYDDLPQHLRKCFLYLSIFPEDYVIRRDTLIQRWLSELIGYHGQDLQELGESYFYQLLDAGMIQPIEFDNNLRVLVLEGSLKNQHVAKYLGSLRHLRYLILASTEITAIPKNVGNLQFLRTLDLRATSVNELPCTFVGLKQLRCLLINRSTKVTAGICKLQALEELQDIDISKSPDILEGICSLPEMRVLRISLWSWDDSSSKLFPETLCKLRTTELKHLSISTCCSVEFKPNDIQKVFQHIEKLEIQHSMFNTLPTWMAKFQKLSSLSIEVYLLEEDALRILGGLNDLIFLSLTAKKTPEGNPTAKRTPEGRVVNEDKLVVRSNGFGNLKTFHLFSRAMVIKFEQGSMKELERLKLSLQASLTMDDFSFGLENLSSLKHAQLEIICFNATEKAVKKAEDAIRGMIWASPNQPRPALDIRRSAEEYMIEDKTSCDGRTASVQKRKGKGKGKGKMYRFGRVGKARNSSVYSFGVYSGGMQTLQQFSI